MNQKRWDEGGFDEGIGRDATPGVAAGKARRPPHKCGHRDELCTGNTLHKRRQIEHVLVEFCVLKNQ